MMRWVWLTPRMPWPPEDGAARATVQLVRAVSSSLEIELRPLVFEEPKSSLYAESAAALGVRDVKPVLRPKTWKSILGKSFVQTLLPRGLPLTVLPFAHIPTQGQSEAAVFLVDGLHVAASLPPRARYFYRAHNVESDLWGQKARASWWPLSLFFWLQEFKMKAFEDGVVRGAVCTFCVSAQDSARLLKRNPNAQIETLPIGWDFEGEAKPELNEKEPAAPAEGQLKLLFVGKLDWLPNQEGLLWFLEEVFPSLRTQRECELTIIGSGSSEVFSPWKNVSGIKFVGRVPEVEPYYRAADCSLVPLFLGSGTRVKVIEAGALSCPVISTELGVEGLGYEPGEHYIKAETAVQWVEVLAKYSKNRANAIAQQAKALLRKNWDAQVIGQRFVKTVSAIATERQST